MDKLVFYRQCIQELLTEYSKVSPINGDIEVQKIFDTEHNHYQMLNLGWEKHRRIYNCVMHLDIIPLLSLSGENNLGCLQNKTFTKNLDFRHYVRK
ncbi:MAG: element excision factor XisI family protein [Aulosira sp. DedQUE10]|nr:element excision factor XisI family protein [Aulosira sp. DedQUE10]